MIRYLVSMVCVALAVAFTGYAVTGFVPPAYQSVLIHTFPYNAIDNTDECFRAFKDGQSNSAACSDIDTLFRMSSPGVVTKVIYRPAVQTPTVGIDCDISLRIAGANVGTVWTLDTEVPGDVIEIAENSSFAAADLLQIHVADGGGTCNQATDAWLIIQVYGYYTG